MAPTAGFEPATKWLTATYSTAELCRSVMKVKKYIIKGIKYNDHFGIFLRFLHKNSDMISKNCRIMKICAAMAKKVIFIINELISKLSDFCVFLEFWAT